MIDFYNTLFELHKKRHAVQQPVSIFGLILEVLERKNITEAHEDPLYDYKIEHHWEERI